MKKNNILLNLFIKLIIVLFIFSSLYYVVDKLNNNMYVSVYMKQSLDRKVELYYRDYLGSPFSGHTVNEIKNKRNSSENFERFLYIIPKNRLDNLTLRNFGDASEKEINYVDIEKIDIYTIFNHKRLEEFDDYSYEVNGRLDYTTLYEGFIFNKWDLVGKVKLYCMIISIAIVAMWSKKIDKYFYKADKTLYKEKFVSIVFATSLISIFLINTLTLDDEYSYIDRSRTVDKPEVENYRRILSGDYFSEYVEYVKSNFFYRPFILEDYYAFNRFLGQKTFNSKFVYKSGDETYIWLSNKASIKTIADNASNIVKLNKILEEKNIPFHYYSVPDKESLNLDKVPTYLVGEANNKVYGDTFVSTLEDGDVDVYNLYNLFKENFVDKGLPTHYVLDTHWRFETAFSTYQYMVENLKEANVLAESAEANEDDYNFDIYYDQFSGWLGRSVGYGYRYNQNLDDFTLITPKNDFKVGYTDHSKKKKEVVGNWSKFINQETINSIENYDYKYGLYISSANYTLRNTENTNGKKAVFLRDSFGVPISWFLINNFESITVLDQRNLPDEYILDYLENEDYDVVLGISYYNSTYNKSLYDYFN